MKAVEGIEPGTAVAIGKAAEGPIEHRVPVVTVGDPPRCG
jgi:hypothetical protein